MKTKNSIYLLILCAAFVLFPEFSSAAPPASMGNTARKLCAIVNELRGSTGIAIAAFSVITLALSTILGRGGVIAALVVIVSIVFLFSAGSLATYLTEINDQCAPAEPYYECIGSVACL
jgi:type IV secretory pathway VirB2 component (pilin)